MRVASAGTTIKGEVMEHLVSKSRASLRLLVMAAALFTAGAATADDTDLHGYLVQGGELGELKRAVLAVGGQVTHEFSRIQALGTVLTDEQRQRLSGMGGVLVVAEESLLPDAKPARG